MSNWLWGGLVVVGWTIASAIVMSFLAKREKRREQESADDPGFELRRAQWIVGRAGELGILALLVGSGLLAASAATLLFISLITGDITLKFAVQSVTTLVFAAAVYFWCDRILTALRGKSSN